LAPSSAIVKVLRRAKSTEELKVSPKHSGEHDLSFRYWEEAKTTFLAPESYYKKKEVELEGVLKRNSLGGYAADVGCGDGRFTQIISKFFVSVEAIDPSPRLISEARRTSRERETSNIEFYVDRLEDSPTLSTYDTVFVMGVTSGFLDDAEFKRSTLRIKSMLNPGGLLILTETLSLKEEQRISWQGYRAVYRNLNNYLIHWRSSGFSLIESIVLAEDVTAMRKTSIYVYRMES
jgi:2-polyprenyl-3-methyl-5-hydroxy-6-metoxy-1,4-benzoquinol methylase